MHRKEATTDQIWQQKLEEHQDDIFLEKYQLKDLEELWRNRERDADEAVNQPLSRTEQTLEKDIFL